MNALRFFCWGLVMILSTFSRSVWISVYIRAGIFSNGKRTPYFERQLRRLDIFVANDSRMIPRRMLHWGSRKKISQSLIGTSGVVRCWTADIFSKSNIHFLEVVRIKSTYLWIQAHHRMSALGNVLPEVYSVQDLTSATYAISRVDRKRYLKFKSIKLWDKFFTGLRKAIGDQTNLTRLTMSITL